MMANRYKLVLGLICLLTMVFCFGQAVLAESNPADVPPSHWAYKAVKLLVDKGYLQLYQDQTFKGEKPVDRYTLAVIVAKILNEIATGKAGTNQGDMDLVKKLTNEYWNELVQVSSKNNLFVRKIDQVAKDNQVIKEDLTKNTAQIQQLADDQAALQEQTAQHDADIERLSADQETLQADVAQNTAAIQKLDEDLAAQQKAFQQQAQQIINDLQKLAARVQKLEEENSRLHADIDRLRIENEQNRKKQNTLIIMAIVLGLVGAAN
jgi:type I site-specific restriction endonuclease